MTERWEKLSDLFQAALERTPGDREAFLDEACGGDTVLRAEVVSLLGAHDESAGFLEQPAAHVAEALGAEEIEPLAVGERVGSYLVKEQIGRGGMGIVYLAEDTRLGREVALKVLPPEFSRDPPRRDRLRLEARAAATLSHPGIATVYALEEIGNTLFLVFEYVRGRTLREEADDRPMAPQTAIGIGVDIARALAAAHARGIVHRDLKPDNVILSESGSVKVLDFGIARVEGGTGDGKERITRAGAILGTPAYMSPEQIEGKDVDFRSDLFSFGVLMYELVSGSHPFEGPTPLSTAARVLAAEPPVLWERNALVPHELDRIIRRCLRKTPTERYQSTGDLVLDLERLLQATGTQALSPPKPGQPAGPARALACPRTWWQLHQVGVMLVYAAMVYPAWQAREWTGGALGVAPFVALVVGAVFNGTLRVHMR
jgi:eukaryotic-like serine/threonine-protein kinase